MVIKLCVVQFWSEIILVNSNHAYDFRPDCTPLSSITIIYHIISYHIISYHIISYHIIFICNRAGFCSIRENIRASLVEPWFVFWTITCLSFLTEKCILKTKLSRLEKLHSCVNARTHQFPALGRPYSFKR